jgi:carbonic anhydrase
MQKLHTRSQRFALGTLLMLACIGAHAGERSAPHWEYKGKAGPQAWGELDESFAGCKLGRTQSPIDIRNARKARLAPLDIIYRPTEAEVLNTGHTIQVNLNNAGTLTLDGVAYKLVQFHFHTPSEEHVNGKVYPMVAHLVHKSDDGKLAVIGVLLKAGKANLPLGTVFDNMSREEGGKKALGQEFDAARLLPADLGYYKFEGSLTTPPCSEGVHWRVLKTPVEVSRNQINEFQKLYKANARPVQPLNGRTVEQS